VTSKVLRAARMELHVASWGQSSPNHNMRYAAKLVVGDERLALGLAKPPFAEMLAVVSNCLPSLYRYAYRQLGNKTDAEDAVQDALLAAYKHLNQFRGDSQFSTWLTTIVINCARMHLRKRSRYVHVSLDSRTGEDGEHPLSDLLVDHRSSFRQRDSSCSGSSHRNRQSPDSPRASETAEGDARTPPPRPSGTKLPLARAPTKEQPSCTRNQIAGLISLVPHADDL
jgi:RNA polymerase sigma factor (sigma-70 family)